jgi:hypothetical protein
MESKEPEPLDLISKYKLLDYPESKTRRCLELFRMFFTDLYPYVNYAMYLHANRKGVEYEKGIVNIIGELYTLLPSARSDEMSKVKDILEAYLIEESDYKSEQPIWVEFSDEEIDKLAIDKKYEDLHRMRRDLNRFGEQNPYYNDIRSDFEVTDIFNGGDIPNHNDKLAESRIGDGTYVPLFSIEAGVSEAPSVFVTPESVDRAYQLWSKWGPERGDYKYIFCLLQICKIQDILHLARIRNELQNVEEFDTYEILFNDGNDIFYRMMMLQGGRPLYHDNRRSYVKFWYRYIVQHETQDDRYYFNYAVMILDSPIQTIPVDMNRLRTEPSYAKKWIFDCITDFCDTLED